MEGSFGHCAAAPLGRASPDRRAVHGGSRRPAARVLKRRRIIGRIVCANGWRTEALRIITDGFLRARRLDALCRSFSSKDREACNTPLEEIARAPNARRSHADHPDVA